VVPLVGLLNHILSYICTSSWLIAELNVQTCYIKLN